MACLEMCKTTELDEQASFSEGQKRRKATRETQAKIQEYSGLSSARPGLPISPLSPLESLHEHTGVASSGIGTQHPSFAQVVDIAR
ncbi:hypothetical protein CVT26_012014 [Gymnopilus dilepis]|uniref:Uncharacterized protein n=1 Tax=Gymnopilus dilepis TaxID=231916 RepID=A0A409YHV3_9AGAR|nr:hypothetical protein CVT26_012014 [Gymnopilus dilepis]